MTKKRSADDSAEGEAKRNRSMADGTAVQIDEDLHSRQLAVYGRETMRRLAGARVLVAGMNGLGVEVAKNVILAGVHAVVVQDTAATTVRDLGAQFYLAEADVGRNRAEACVAKLQDLNPGVAVTAVSTPVTEELLAQFEAVVFTDVSLEDATRFDAFCHAHNPPIAFIKAETRGVFASIFADYGPSFTVIDTDGEQPRQGIIACISPGTPTMVSCVDDERLEFQDGDMVVFTEVKGMEGLNDAKPLRVKNCKAHSFEIEEDLSSFGEYKSGGMVVEEKQPKTLVFKTLKDAIAAPGEFLLSDFSKLDRSALLHMAFQALDAFRKENGRLPAPGSAADGDNILAKVNALNAAAPEGVKVDAVDEKVVRLFASGSSGEVNPMAAVFGGLVGQEAIKACTGKFHPLFQWFYFDSVESLPSEPLSAEEVAPTGSRYDGQVAVFGRTLQAKMQASKVFLVGAGALGCEFIKNFALMGVGCGTGEIVMTDDDVIEKSNLSRQFLFRNTNIGQPKSTVAAAAAIKINPDLKVRSLQNRVSPETENVFDDTFWTGLDLITNALDNVNARLYVDSRCVYFNKPLLESGTLGTKCNVQMVIPALTENYGASRDPPEKSAPMCTVHSFPHNIDHCLTWAKSEFEGLFSNTPSQGNAYLEKPSEYAAAARQAGDAQARENLELVADCLLSSRMSSFEECIKWARLRFQDYFNDRIAQLTFTFPEDAPTSTGAPFWSPPKRFPRFFAFDPTDDTHVRCVHALATLKAEVYGLPRPAWHADLSQTAKLAAAVDVPPFVPRSGVKIETDPKAQKSVASTGDDESIIGDLIDKLAAAALGGVRVAPITFEKDDDTNYHMEAIAGLANMRARNYSIQEVDKLKAKLIAGRIIPAIATATAMATGFVCLEFYKVLQSKKVEDFRNTFANLALPLFAMAEPIPPKKFTFQDLNWTLWDRWILEGDLTVQELLQWFEAKGLTAYSVSCGQSLIYNNIFPKHKERMGRKVSELVKEVAKMDIPANRAHFDIVVACEDDNGEDVDTPLVSIKFR